MFTIKTICLLNITIKKFSYYSLIRFASWNTNNKLHEVGLFTAVKQEGNYETGQNSKEHVSMFIRGHLS
ncbi:unnamed protein product [Rotaria socialis]